MRPKVPLAAEAMPACSKDEVPPAPMPPKALLEPGRSPLFHPTQSLHRYQGVDELTRERIFALERHLGRCLNKKCPNPRNPA
jgi:hypothetical protein